MSSEANNDRQKDCDEVKIERTGVTEGEPNSYFYFAWSFAAESGHQGDYLSKESLEKLGWKRLGKADDLCRRSSESAVPDIHSYIDRYAVWQYLGNDARQIFGDLNPAGHSKEDEGFCHIYTMEAGPSDRYIIKGRDNKREAFSYELVLEGLELHCYTFGCGVLWIKTHGTFNEPKDTKRITEAGRRTCIPYIPDSCDRAPHVNATKLILNIGDKHCVFDPVQSLEDVKNKKKPMLPENIDFFRPIRMGENGEFHAKPLNDDRMFVMELIRDRKLSLDLRSPGDGIRSWSANPTNKETVDFQKSIYEYVYIDMDDDCCCQDTQMCTELLNDAIMPRWADAGTIYAATNYSFVCLMDANPELNASVARVYLNQYIYIASLVLAQRMGLASYSQRAGRISAVPRGKDKHKNSARSYRELAGLQREFVAFENQMLIGEISNQQPGIELYKLLSDQLRIGEEQESLNEQLGSLYEVMNSGVGDSISRLGLWLALVAVLADFAKDIIENLIDNHVWEIPYLEGLGGLAAIVGITFAIIYYVVPNRKHV